MNVDVSVGVVVIVGVLSLVYLGGKGGIGSLGALDALEPESLQEAALGTDAQAEVGPSVPVAAPADVDGIEPGPAAGESSRTRRWTPASTCCSRAPSASSPAPGCARVWSSMPRQAR